MRIKLRGTSDEDFLFLNEAELPFQRSALHNTASYRGAEERFGDRNFLPVGLRSIQLCGT